MANERAVLCGTAPGGRLPVDDAEPLRLRMWGDGANVNLRIGDFGDRLCAEVPPAFLDLIDLATYVYAADQSVGRGGAGDVSGASWRRNLFFRVPVRLPEVWRDAALTAELTGTLGFLSEDEYRFDFVPMSDPPPSQRYFDFGDRSVPAHIDEVVLFSGGLDSLGGAVREAVSRRNRVMLVNHRSSPKLTPRQNALVTGLTKASAHKPAFVPVRVNKSEGLTREYTQRTRSFLFASLGAAIARTLELPRLRFYENGVVSLNLPLCEQVIGARASRTTHPRVLRGFGRLFSALASRPFAVENPFQWETKEEVVRLVADAGLADLIRYTVSCAHTHAQTKDSPHCGVCSQCIDRRFAVLAAGQPEADPRGGYRVELLRGEREEGHPRTMLAAYVATAMGMEAMDAAAFFAKYGEAARALRHLDGTPAEAGDRLFDLHRRHAAGVMRVVTEAVRDNAADIARFMVPDNCLVGMVCDVRPPRPAPPQAPPEPDPPVSAAGVPNGECVYRWEGGGWRVRFGGRSFVLPDRRGAAYLRLLLESPEVGIPVVQLAYRVTNNPVFLDRYRGQQVADDVAMEAYREECQDLAGRIAEARGRGDQSEADRLLSQLEMFADHIRTATGLNRRRRRTNDPREKVRKAASNAFASIRKVIATYGPEFAAHLTESLRCGACPIYRPRTPIDWQF